jgi:hypothetical protein
MSTENVSTPAATAEAPDKGVGCDALLGFRLFGARARDGVTKLYKQPVEWEIFSKTFGWFKHRNKNNYTPEQLAAIEDGYRNWQAVKKRVRKPNNKLNNAVNGPLP